MRPCTDFSTYFSYHTFNFWLQFLGGVGVYSDCQGLKNPHGFWVGYAGVRVGVSFFNPWQTLTPGQGLRVYPPTISHGFLYMILPLLGLYHLKIVGLCDNK